MQKTVSTKKPVGDPDLIPIIIGSVFLGFLIIVAVVLLIVLFVDLEATSSSSSSSVTPGFTINGLFWLAEPLSGPYPYDFSSQRPYYIEVVVAPVTFGMLVCINQPSVALHVALYINEIGQLVHFRNSATNQIIASNFTLTFGTRYILAASYDGENSNLWINGVQPTPPVPSGAITANTNLPLMVGATQISNNIVQRCPGEYFSVAIYNNDLPVVAPSAFYDFTSNPGAVAGSTFPNLGDNGTPNVLTVFNSNTY